MSDDPIYLTVERSCAIVGGEESPINKATFYRNFRDLIEHPSPGISRVEKGRLLGRLAARRNGEGSNGTK